MGVDFETLKRRAYEHSRIDLQPYIDAFRAKSTVDDLDGFLQSLASQRDLPKGLVTELCTLGDVELPTMSDPSLAGTMLAMWAEATLAGPSATSLSRGNKRPHTNSSQASSAATIAGPVSAMPKRGADADGTMLDPNAPKSRLATAAPVMTGSIGASGAPVGAAAPRADVHYQPLVLLGQGAMGAVHVARDTYLRRKVAVKTVLPEMGVEPELVERFFSEMRITAQLEHPNIVPIYGVEISPDGTLGYAMKLVQGQDLAVILEEAAAMAAKGLPFDEDHTLEKRLEYFLRVCDALELAHSKGIVHRDLKPANIMIGRQNEVYLMDWGIARPMGQGGQAIDAGLELEELDMAATTNLGRTQVGSVIGTPAYMSPEQAEGRNAQLDGRSDQYSMGLILQECVTLKRAVTGLTLQELLTKAKTATREPVAVGLSPGNLPKELDAIVKKATQHSPKDRYPSVRALADDVRRYLRNEAVSVLPDSTMQRAGRWISKHRMVSLSIMLGLGLAGSVATIGTLLAGQAKVAALHAQELKVSEFQTESAIQAQLVDRELNHYEVALSKLVGAVQRTLSQPSAGFIPFYEEMFAQKAPIIADLAPAPRYGRDISIVAPVVTFAPGVETQGLDPEVKALGVLSAAFRELFIGSAGGQSQLISLAAARDVIGNIGVPAYRVTLILQDGAQLSYPGMSGRTGTDLRKDPVYRFVEENPGTHWGDPVTSDKGVLLPLGVSIFDEKGNFRGVALLEVSLDKLLSRPGAAKLDYVQSKKLVARDGTVMAEENGPGGAAPMNPAVLTAISKGDSGSLRHSERGREWLTTYYPLASLDWYYVAIADVSQMQASPAKIAPSDPRKISRAAASAVAPVANARKTSPVVAPPVASVPAPDAPVPAAATANEPSDTSPKAAADPPAQDPAPASGASGNKGGDKKKGTSKPKESPPGKPAETAAPRNPFDKWQEYGSGKGH